MSYETKQRDELLSFFEKNKDKSFSACEIFKALDDKKISLSAIYRNLAELEKLGKVRKVTKKGSNSFFYRFLDLDECKGHVHLSCTECGKTIHLSQKESKSLSLNLLKNLNFSLDTKSAVLLGKCASCQKKAKQEE